MSPFAIRPRFWLVLFDCLQMPSIKLQESITTDVVDQLEVKSVFFEQFLIQNSRTGTDLGDALGGRECCEAFLRQLTLHGRTFRQLQIAPDSENDIAPRIDESRLFPGQSPLQTLLLTSTSIEALSPEDRNTLADTDVLLITIATQSHPADTAAMADHGLSLIHKLASHLFHDGEAPTLLVTALRGTPCPAPPSLQFGIDEGLVRVPAWYRNPTMGAGRVQTICGSYDLLPSILGWIKTVGSDAAAASALAAEQPSDVCFRGTLPLFTELPGAEDSERMLRLQGDGWTALRTQQYLLVTHDNSGHDAYAPEDPLRQLYLKPDDYWNVNDVIVSYGEIASLMLQAEAESLSL